LCAWSFLPFIAHKPPPRTLLLKVALAQIRRNRSMNKFSFWVFGLIMLALLLAIFFIMGLSVGAGSRGEMNLGEDALSSWVAALATVAIAVLTMFLAKETWSLRQVQIKQMEQIRKDSIKPNINLFLRSDSDSLNMMEAHVENSGTGPAHDVKFTFRKNSEVSDDVFAHVNEQFKKLVIFNTGITTLGSGEKRHSFVFNFLDLTQEFKARIFEYNAIVDISYLDREGQECQSNAIFNFSEYLGISNRVGKNPLKEISKSLDTMSKDLGHMTTGFKKLQVDIYNNEDRNSERMERERQALTAEDMQKIRDNLNKKS